MPSGKAQVVAVTVAAALAVGLSSVSAVPVNQEPSLVARNPINAAARAGAKLAGDLVQGVATNTLHQKAKNAINPPQSLDPKAAAAIHKMTGPHDPKLVNAVVKPHLKSHKRDLDERDFEEELFVRNPTINAAARAGAKLAGDLAHGVATNSLHQKVKDAVNPRRPLDPKAAAAIHMMSGHHDPKIVNAVVNNPHLKGHKRRDLYEFDERDFNEDSELYERDFADDESELFVRNPAAAAARAAARLAGDLAHGVATNTLHQKVKNAVNPPRPLDPKAAEAIRKASGPFDPKLVNVVVNNPHLKTHKRRDLYEFDERDFDGDSELYERGFDEDSELYERDLEEIVEVLAARAMEWDELD